MAYLDLRFALKVNGVDICSTGRQILNFHEKRLNLIRGNCIYQYSMVQKVCKYNFLFFISSFGAIKYVDCILTKCSNLTRWEIFRLIETNMRKKYFIYNSLLNVAVINIFGIL
jgi:hypothetical protein